MEYSTDKHITFNREVSLVAMQMKTGCEGVKVNHSCGVYTRVATDHQEENFL